MPVDVHIGTVETKLTATDPELLRSPEFMRRLVALVKQELVQDEELKARRTSDRMASRNPGAGR